MTTITTDWLNERDACEDDVALFRDTFGESAELTRANLVRAAEVGLDLGWLARNMLTPSQFRDFAEADDRARQIYAETAGRAWRTFNEATAEPQRIYRESETEPRRTFDEARDRARRTYAETIAEALTTVLGLE